MHKVFAIFLTKIPKVFGRQCLLTISRLVVGRYSLRISLRPVRSLGEMFKLTFIGQAVPADNLGTDCLVVFVTHLTSPDSFPGLNVQTFVCRGVSLGFVGAAIGRPPTNCNAICWFFAGNNRLSPCGDVILFHKITRTSDARPYYL